MKGSRLKRRSNIIAAITGSIITLGIITIATVLYLRFYKVEDSSLPSLEEYVHIDDLTEIVVAKVDILQGGAITEDMVDTILIQKHFEGYEMDDGSDQYGAGYELYDGGAGSEYITDSRSILGQFSRVPIKKGMPLVKGNLCKEINMSHDLRNHELTFIELPSLLEKGNYIDIRISFPDGEDYIVVAKKHVEKVELDQDNDRSTMWIHMLENERLHLSSAIVEAAAYEGSRIYAISYVLPEFQEEAIVNYPVNQNVYDLIMANPNIVDESIKRLTIRGSKSYEKYQEGLSIYE